MTDFGTDSPYIAAMKGAIYERLPRAVIVDLTHGIEPQNVRQGAFVWYDFTRTFPRGTVHVGVVDPGVGGKRRIIAARWREQYFICPDNGLLTLFMWVHAPDELIEVTNPTYWRTTVSATFHGRDIMAPVAAAISGGVPLSELGIHCDINSGHAMPPEIRPMDRPVFEENEWHLEVLYIDRFGNLLFNAAMDMLPEKAFARLKSSEKIMIRVKKREYAAMFVSTYCEMKPETLVLLVSSSERLELASVNGNAAKQLAIHEGEQLTVCWD